jgi:hypothetical protein
MSKKGLLLSVGTLALLLITVSFGLHLPHEPTTHMFLSHLGIAATEMAVAVAVAQRDQTAHFEEPKTFSVNTLIDHRKPLAAGRSLLDDWIRKRLTGKTKLFARQIKTDYLGFTMINEKPASFN